jgi:hypothetical protein
MEIKTSASHLEIRRGLLIDNNEQTTLQMKGRMQKRR